MASFFMIPANEVDRVWPGRVANLVDKAYAFADDPMPADILEQLRQRHRQLWVVWNGRQVVAAGITRIANLRSGKVCQIVAAGGSELETWKDVALPIIEDFAKREGCRKVTIEGRPGWERLFKSYRRARVVIEKEV